MHTITYAWLALILWLFVGISCAYGGTLDLAILQAIKSDVDSRYVYQHRYTSIFNEMQRPDDGTANCVKFALEYGNGMVEACPAGCKLTYPIVWCNGTTHAYLVVNGKWVLDSNHSKVITIEEQECR
jgi:hypothetical protein